MSRSEGKQPPRPGADRTTEPARILLVDDDRDLVDVMRLVLEQRGHWGHGWIGNVPYVYVDRWSAPLDGFDALLESYRDAPGLVVDVRSNPGGNSAYALPVLERIYDQPRVAAYTR